MRRRRTTALAGSVALALALAACGGTKSSTTSTRSATATTSGAQSNGTQSQTSASTPTGQIHATFMGENHTPKANKNWSYTVTARDAQGHPLSGTVETEFTFGGQVVGRETPPVHQLKDGMLHDVIMFPSSAVGQPISVQVVIHTGAGSKTLSWPVQVSQ